MQAEATNLRKLVGSRKWARTPPVPLSIRRSEPPLRPARHRTRTRTRMVANPTAADFEAGIALGARRTRCRGLPFRVRVRGRVRGVRAMLVYCLGAPRPDVR